MDYERFLKAQELVYAEVLQELRSGNKASHWMWFIFPQLRDLGRSQTARFYGLENLVEAKLYLKHPVLGVRLKECTALVMQHHDKTALEILHRPDDLKFRSCMTLFKLADPQEPLFLAALNMFFKNGTDDMTIQLVKSMPG
jgi:uncharacterized protein (DUF1810 family)